MYFCVEIVFIMFTVWSFVIIIVSDSVRIVIIIVINNRVGFFEVAVF